MSRVYLSSCVNNVRVCCRRLVSQFFRRLLALSILFGLFHTSFSNGSEINKCAHFPSLGLEYIIFGEKMNADEIEFEIEQQEEEPTFLTRLLCCFKKTTNDEIKFDDSADNDFHADKIIRLTDGYTAYRLLEPKRPAGDTSSLPLIILLHGMHNASYMWADVAELLACFEQGPQAQVLIMDFYGHGRSPWDGRNLSLDCLVTQVRELMDGKWCAKLLLLRCTFIV